MYICKCLCKCKYACIRLYVCECVHARMCVCVNVCMYTYIEEEYLNIISLASMLDFSHTSYFCVFYQNLYLA